MILLNNKASNWVITATMFFSISLFNLTVQAQASSNANLLSRTEQIPILSADYKIAKKALDQAVADRDEATVRVGLKTDSVLVRQEVFKAIADLYYQWFVPDLINALEKNQTIDTEGVKTRAEQAKLNKSIVTAIGRLTGLQVFANEKILPVEEFLEVRDKTSQWYETYASQIEEAKEEERLMMRQEISILSKYYYLANRAFEKAVVEKDKATLRLGLKAFSLDLKCKVVTQIKQLNDNSFVADLIESLEGNQAMMSEGSEGTYEQNLLDREIISAIEKLTGLQFSYFDKSVNRDRFFNDSAAVDIERVLKETREWCESHSRECELKNRTRN